MTKPIIAAPEVNCIGKDKHKSMELALDIAKRMSRSHDTPVSAYRCPHCGFFHVGNRIQTKRSKFYGRPK